MENLALHCKFSHYCITCGNCYHFQLKNMVAISTRIQQKYWENLRTSQGYIFRILQHCVTKFWNFTTFKRFFPGICFFVWICLNQKLLYIGNCPFNKWAWTSAEFMGRVPPFRASAVNWYVYIICSCISQHWLLVCWSYWRVLHILKLVSFEINKIRSSGNEPNQSSNQFII